MKSSKIVIALLFVSSVNGQGVMPKLNGDPDTVTISGFSSGAAFSNILHLALSDIIVGSGTSCGYPPVEKDEKKDYSVGLGPLIIAKYDKLISEKKIPDPTNTIKARKDPVHIFSGTQDVITAPHLQRGVEDLYKKHGANVFFDSQQAGHNWVESSTYSMSEKTLSYLLKNLKTSPISTLKPKAATGEYLNLGDFEKFATSEFTGGLSPKESGIAEFLYVYTPKKCKDGTLTTCKVHLNFHGGGMSYINLGESFMKQTQLMDYAATNDLIIIFPHADVNPVSKDAVSKTGQAKSKDSYSKGDWESWTKEDWAKKEGDWGKKDESKEKSTVEGLYWTTEPESTSVSAQAIRKIIERATGKTGEVAGAHYFQVGFAFISALSLSVSMF